METHADVGVARLGRWVGVTFAGWTAGFFLAILFIVVVDSMGVLQTQFPLALGMGTGVGYAQARLLSAFLDKRSTWVWATALGLAAPFAIADVANALGRPVPFNLAAYVAIGGVVVALWQWLLLRRVATHSTSWLVATPLGWILASAFVLINDLWLRGPIRIPGIVGALLYVGVVLAGGLVLGLCTAPAARRMTRQR